MKVYVVMAGRDGLTTSPDAYASFEAAMKRAEELRADTTLVAEAEADEMSWVSLPTLASSVWDSVTIYVREVGP